MYQRDDCSGAEEYFCWARQRVWLRYSWVLKHPTGFCSHDQHFSVAYGFRCTRLHTYVPNDIMRAWKARSEGRQRQTFQHGQNAFLEFQCVQSKKDAVQKGCWLFFGIPKKEKKIFEKRSGTMRHRCSLEIAPRAVLKRFYLSAIELSHDKSKVLIEWTSGNRWRKRSLRCWWWVLCKKMGRSARCLQETNGALRDRYVTKDDAQNDSGELLQPKTGTADQVFIRNSVSVHASKRLYS